MSQKNDDGYLDFTTNPSLADALADCNAGETVKLEMEVTVLSKDDNGLAFKINPGTVVPEGYEQEEPGPDDEPGEDTTVPAPQPPGSLATEPVVVAMKLKKKGGK